MKTKKIQKPFSIEAWKNGAKVETRDGRSARLICTDLNSIYSIAAAITNDDGEEHTDEYDTDGHYSHGQEDVCDLVIVEEVEEPKRWADDEKAFGIGWYIDEDSNIQHDEFLLNHKKSRNAFTSDTLAKSALAMARISQLMKHDERYGGVVTDEEWRNNKMVKLVLYRSQGAIARKEPIGEYHFLAFHKPEQRDLFLSENEELVKDYLMLD